MLARLSVRGLWFALSAFFGLACVVPSGFARTFTTPGGTACALVSINTSLDPQAKSGVGLRFVSIDDAPSSRTEVAVRVISAEQIEFVELIRRAPGHPVVPVVDDTALRTLVGSLRIATNRFPGLSDWLVSLPETNGCAKLFLAVSDQGPAIARIVASPRFNCSQPEPTYPRQAMLPSYEAEVVLRTRVVDGVPRTVDVISNTGPAYFASAATQAVRAIRCSKPSVDSSAPSFDIEIPLNFKLSDLELSVDHFLAAKDKRFSRDPIVSHSRNSCGVNGSIVLRMPSAPNVVDTAVTSPEVISWLQSLTPDYSKIHPSRRNTKVPMRLECEIQGDSIVFK